MCRCASVAFGAESDRPRAPDLEPGPRGPPAEARARSGRIIDKPCVDCAGRGQRQGEDSLKVKIPAGIEEGTILRILGRGLHSPRFAKTTPAAAPATPASFDFLGAASETARMSALA